MFARLEHLGFGREQLRSTALDLLHDLEVHLGRRHDTMTMREIGTFVANAFADERRKMNTIIEDTIGRLRGGPRSGVMPTLQTQIVETPTPLLWVRSCPSSRPTATSGS